MKKSTILILFVFSITCLIAQGFSFNASEDGFSMTVTGEDNTTTTTNVNNSGEVINKIAEKLDVLQNKYNAKLNKLDGKRANNIIDEIYSLLALLPENSTLIAPQTNDTPQTESSNTTVNINVSGLETQTTQVEEPVAPINTNPGMSDSDFSNLIRRIQDEGFSDDQMRVIRTAAKKHSFKVNQIVRILDCFSFADDKLSALTISYPGCVDPNNNYEILDAFTYSDDKSQAERIINAD